MRSAEARFVPLFNYLFLGLSVILLALSLGCGGSSSWCAAVPPPADTAEVVEQLFDAVNERDLAALDALVADDLIQHNPGIDNGREAFRTFLADTFASSPDYHADVRRLIASDDLVAVHSHVTRTAAERGGEFAGLAVSDIYRIEAGQIVEHWDSVQEVPFFSVNGNSMFDGAVPDPEADVPELRMLADEFVAVAFNGMGLDLERLDDLLEGYVQHNPLIQNTPDGLRAFLGLLFSLAPDYHADVRRVIAQGDFVAVHHHSTITLDSRGDEFTGLAIVDWFHARDGRFVEHWDTIQEVPPTSVSGNSMF